MLDLTAPLWLSALAALPLIRWLHRFRFDPAPWPVSALFLSSAPEASLGPGARRGQPDPIWRWRAVLAALLAVAAAGPVWTTAGSRPVDIWFDDGRSMRATDGQIRRLDRARRKLLAALDEVESVRPLVRSLSRPDRTLLLDPARRDRWDVRLRTWLGAGGEDAIVLPDAGSLDPRREHWLVTDGATPELAPWLRRAPIARLIRVGRDTENVAVAALAVRRAASESGPLRAVATLTNLGDEPASRRLEVTENGSVRFRYDAALAPGQSASPQFSLNNAGATTVTARVSPADALHWDDALQLTAATSPVSVRVRGSCGRHLLTALRSHPVLKLDPNTTAPGLTVICATHLPSDLTGATLWLTPPGSGEPVSGVAVWRSAADGWPRSYLDSAWLRVAGNIDSTDETTLLRVGARSLIGEIPGRDVLFVRFDMEAPALVREPVYPALIAALIDRVLDRSLLDGVSVVSRSVQPSRIAPQALAVTGPQAVAARQDLVRDLTPYLLITACVVLLAELRRTWL